jgi:hypothetical protein
LPSPLASQTDLLHRRRFGDDDRGVHGGEYGNRPGMNESMVFLRKLFTHQQHEGGITTTLPNLMSPLDGPMRKSIIAIDSWFCMTFSNN